MLRKFLMVPAALAVGGLLLAAGSAQAQHRGGGGGGHVSSAHVGAAHVGNVGHVAAYHGGANYGHGYYGGNAYRHGYGYGGLYGGAYWPGYNPLYQPYAYGAYPYLNAYPSYAPDYAPSYAYDYTPTMPNYAQSAPAYSNNVANNGAAAVEVIVPDPQARVWFDGTLTRQTGTDRMFQTAVLSTSGTYRIRATWNDGGRQVTQERVVSVAPNQTAVVDFTRPAGG